MVGNTEENTSLSRALSQLAEIEEKIDQLHQDQADSDFFVLSELIKDYIMLIGSIKVKGRYLTKGLLLGSVPTLTYLSMLNTLYLVSYYRYHIT